MLLFYLVHREQQNVFPHADSQGNVLTGRVVLPSSTSAEVVTDHLLKFVEHQKLELLMQ